MKREIKEAELFEYWSGTLPKADAAKIEAALSGDAVLHAQYDEQRRIFQGCKTLGEQQFSAGEMFMEVVMESVVRVDRRERLYLFLKRLALVLVLLWLTGVALLFPPSLLTYLEGSAGALIMVSAGIAAIFMAAFGQYRGALGFMTVAVSAFMLRSLTTTFYNDQNFQLVAGRDDGYDDNRTSSTGRGIRYNDDRIVTHGGITGWLFGSGSQTTAPKPLPGIYHVDPQVIPPSYPSQQGGTSDNKIGSYSGAENSSGESYGQYEEQPRIDPRQNPVSTFSIDVDTGSYSNMRRYLQSGNLPPADSVRIEEFLNYFDYRYENTTDKPFAVTYEVAPSPFLQGRHLLRLGIKARTIPMDNERGWNLVFLVDVSGSMSSADKLPLLKQSLKLLASRMRPVDRIALVAYAGNAGLVLDSTPGNDQGRIMSAIDRLEAGGSTNGGAGIDLAYSVAIANRIEGSVNRVVLATDGDFNVGTYNFDALMQLIETKRTSGITLTTLGFGTGNLNDRMMEQAADRGNGNYFYIDSFKEARKVLDTGLAANMEEVAKDVKLQIEFNPAAVKEYRLIGFDNRRLRREDFNNDQVDAGEIGSGHTVTALYEVLLSDSPLAAEAVESRRYGHDAVRPAETAAPSDPKSSAELAFLKVRYKEPQASVSKLFEFPLLKSSVLPSAQGASDDFRFSAAVAAFGETLRRGRYANSYSLANVIATARGARGSDENGLRGEFVELAESARTISNTGGAR